MKKRPLLLLATIVILISVSHSQAQVSLVKDINTSPAGLRDESDYTNTFCNCGDYLFFGAMTDKGNELWRTDGTGGGTVMVKDLGVASDDGFLDDMVCNGSGTLFFLGTNGLHGNELYVSDGTANGTRLVKDVTPGAGGISLIGVVGNIIFFLADHDMNGEKEIWKSDGTEANTIMVTIFGGYSGIFKATSSDTHVFFKAVNSTTGKQDFFAVNGLTGNLQKLLEGKTVSEYQSFGSKIMFSVNDPVEKYSLWSSDGTLDGTVKVRQFGTSFITAFFRFNNRLIFSVSGATWISDGTEAGTVYLTAGNAEAGVAVGNYFYGFGYNAPAASLSVFKTDGTTVEVTYLDDDPAEVSMNRNLPFVNNKLILQHYDPATGRELSASDDAHQSFSLLKDIKPGVENSEPRGWAVFKNRAYFYADDGVNGQEIWSTDGTAGGTSLLKNVATGTASAFGVLSAINISEGKLLLNAASPGSQWTSPDLFSSDGTDAGTTFKFDFGVGFPVMYGRTGADLVYYSNWKFYKTNGSTQSVTLFKDFGTQLSSWSSARKTYYTLGNKLIFAMAISFRNGTALGKEYWVTDGTEAGTHILKDINPAGGNGTSGDGAVLDSKLIFDGSAPTEGSELWSTDGTEAGTTLLKDINPGTASSQPLNFTLFKDKVVFTAAESAHGNEVWVTDGTAEGTVLLADIVPGTVGSDARGFTIVGDRLLFIAYDAEKGWCLWKTDGTTEGTLFVKDIESGNEKNNGPGSFTASGNKLYFIATDVAYGKELWVSDGTAQGTQVIDRIPGPASSNPFLLTPIKELVYFKSQGALWRTNGTTPGTVKVADLDPMEIVYFNNWIYFTANHPDYGGELFKVPFTREAQQIALTPIDNKVMGSAPFVIEATASSGLPVTITSEEELSLAGATATIVKPGTVKVTVQQSGDALFDPAPPVSQIFCISPVKPVVTLLSDPSGDPVLTSSAEAGNQWFRQAEVVNGATQKTFQPSENDTYKVQVTIDGCMSNYSDEFYVVVTGLEETYSDITVYPNPAMDVVYIKGDNASSALLNIIDLQGKKLGTHQLQAGGLVEQSLADYPKGMYLIQVVLEKGTSYMKLVKQ
ncbi:T9SS type A sorting domain-containing protein [Fulvivirgaceae bacterium PWU4]|uniref:T9SS type A sorting domain-containing protein n=1 Tax=Chryseosolibacter histidini TaxID=2782349 RepID=A0AAP2GP55_9BACT|nr:T9SS type A sorting domain-containing protein [Chryseosolibacter histidini]MBT1697057.1 T9SS type A sorting domain-containing protein [Chryseosolibacter histidini]